MIIRIPVTLQMTRLAHRLVAVAVVDLFVRFSGDVIVLFHLSPCAAFAFHSALLANEKKKQVCPFTKFQRTLSYRVIVWKNWVPNFTSCYSAVCSLHFVETDFRENTKRCLLKPNAVPSVFPHYPSYMRKVHQR